MHSKIIFTVTLVLALAVAAFLLPVVGPRAQAQQGCAPFHGIIQASLPSPNPFADTDVWGGPIYASLGGELLFGHMSGNDEEPGPGKIGKGRGGSYKICFGDCTDSFTYEVANAVWPSPPGCVSLSSFRSY